MKWWWKYLVMVFYSWEPRIVDLWYMYVCIYGWLIFKRKWKVKCKKLQFKLNCRITNNNRPKSCWKQECFNTCYTSSKMIKISNLSQFHRQHQIIAFNYLSPLKYRSRLTDMRQDVGKCAENRYNRCNYNCFVCVCMCVLGSNWISCCILKHCSEWPRQLVHI